MCKPQGAIQLTTKEVENKWHFKLGMTLRKLKMKEKNKTVSHM